MNSSLTPILFLIFNRPDITKTTFEEIRKQKPKFLYIGADGPREEQIDDIRKCNRTREIISEIDWDCDLKTLFREKNLGSKYAVSSAITWFFEHEDEGIILEDDCMPNSSFFLYCSELLSKYRDDTKIMHISGCNLNDNIKFGDGTYYCSHYATTWGWATWKRAWNKYDLELDDQKLYSKLIVSTFKDFSERLFWNSRLELLKSNKVDAWDYQWLFSIWREKGSCLSSNYNLVTNIGFGEFATHTVGISPYIDPETKSLLNIKHPASLEIIEAAETQLVNIIYGVQRRGYLNYYIRKYVLQKFYNLIHKIRLVKKSE